MDRDIAAASLPKEIHLDRCWDSSQYARTSDLQASAANELICALEIKPDENVLDLGCGLGNLTMDIAAIADRGNVLGIDTSPSMIEQAKSNLQLRRLPNVGFQVANANDLHLDGQFDAVFSNSVFHWIKEQQQTLQSIHRCLKAGGRVGFQFPLLDATHPLVAVTQKAIRSLQLEQRYATWEAPWFVPESPHAYADLLRSLSFNEVGIRQRETNYVFDAASTAYGFFSAVGLELFLQPLSPEEASSLKAKVLKLLTALETERGVSLDFRRLYVLAKKNF